MGHIPVLGHIPFEKRFRFFDLPDTQAGKLVYLMLKKYRHRWLIPSYFAVCYGAKDKSLSRAAVKNKDDMILSDKRIMEEMEKGTIKIERSTS